MNNPIKPSFKSEIVPVFLLLISTIASLYFYSHFPERVPSHWNGSEQVDGYSGRVFGAFFFPCINLGLYLMMLILPMLDPKRERYTQFAKPYHIIKAAILAYMTAFYLYTGLVGLGYKVVSIMMLLPPAMGILFIIIGNYLGKVKTNWFMGVRTPWTLSNEEVWNKTHRLSGKLFVLTGLAFLISVPFSIIVFWSVFVVGILLVSLIPIVYSYVLYKKLTKEGENILKEKDSIPKNSFSKGDGMKYLSIFIALLVIGIVGFFVITQSSKEKEMANAVPTQNVDVKMETSGTAETVGIESLAKELVQDLVKEQYAHSTIHFDATMQSGLPPEKMKEVWKTIQQQAGNFKTIGGTRKEKIQVYDVIYVTCQFEKAQLDVKVVFSADKKVAGLFFIPTQEPVAEYKSPESIDKTKFIEKEITIGTGEWKLPGILTLPKGKGFFPVIILVHGSGPHDRDETVGPNKPFRELAWGLASQGIAVLRYEKRTKEYQMKMAAMKDTITVKEETLDDVNEAMKYVKSAERIDPKKIFILGHSLGGMLIPRIAKTNSDAAGYIILAGLTRPLEDTILEQITYISSLQGKLDKNAETQLAQLKEQVQRVKSKDLSLYTPSSTLPLGAPASYWLDLRGYNPPEMAKSIEKPILILQGERDYQVTVKDFGNWKSALAGKSNVEYKLYPKLNHLFIEGEGKCTPEEYTHPGHVAEYVIGDIATWVKGK